MKTFLGLKHSRNLRYLYFLNLNEERLVEGVDEDAIGFLMGCANQFLAA
jgi:hypothetical protein